MDFTPEQIERGKFLVYSEMVRAETEKTIRKEHVENLKLRGSEYSLDHRLSIKDCFEADIPVFIAGHECNLEVISKTDNLKKGSKSSITPEELWEEFMDRENDLL